MLTRSTTQGPRGKVFRIECEPHPRTVWRTRTEALFDHDEWGWSERAQDAWVFDFYDGQGPYEPGLPISADCATLHVEGLGAQGIAAHAFVYGSAALAEDAERRSRLTRRDEDRAAVLMASARPDWHAGKPNCGVD